MALAIHHMTAQDIYGNAVSGAQVEVRSESDNGLASLFSDRDGAVPISNPTSTDSSGLVAFFVVGGAYKITVTKGSSSQTLRYVKIGLASETDIILSTITGLIREKLTANRTYYVRSDGSDSNTGLTNTSGGAKLTLQGAWDAIVAIDLAGYTATIKIGHSATITGGLNALVAPVGGNIIIEGDTSTPANTIISTTSADAIRIATNANVTVKHTTVQTTSSGYGLSVRAAAARLTVGEGVRFGACASGHILASPGQIAINSISSYTIVGAAPRHYHCRVGGYIQILTLSLAVVGAINFSSAFVEAELAGLVDVFGFSLASGTVTGVRYYAFSGSLIATFGGGASYFPGNSAGSADGASFALYT